MDKGKEKTEEAWVNSFIERTQSIGSRPSQIDPCTICRVPRSIRQGDPDAYEPQIVSIGPYHRANQSLLAMEEYKWQHLNALLSRDHDHSLRDYINEIQQLVDWARCCYSENIKFSNEEFVEMMVLDGCFIIELFLNIDGKRAVDEMGPIYSTKWMVALIGQDMLLLENQLPFFILQHLFDLLNRSNSSSLVDLALNFFAYVLPRNQEIRPSKVVHHDHLLHLFHSHVIPTPRVGPTTTFDHGSPSLTRSIPSITEIQQAGIRLKKKAGNFLDVTYQKGEIQIPTLSIYDSITKTLFRNMIAFEQCHPKSGSYFTSYAIFMYCILETTKDVTVLKQNRIIEHWLGDDQEVVHLFKRMCQGLTVDFNDNYLLGMINHVSEFCNSKWNAWWATLKRVYFGNPWSVFQVEVTIFTLVFTMVQAFLAIMTYYRPRA
ncbi:UPF0481 protein At3g47200-like [Magnolia sinica]|uniref:UPF0481 protein At3g47200-like n=1 Tax=Magnolia sinica TaxID=86752 RepID=UPI002658F9B3|nr:UPF0481 protein At3g47200-like [Magnolia sinica]